MSEKGTTDKRKFTIGPVKQAFERKIVIIFLSIRLNMCFGCSKEPSHRDSTFDYPQLMFWLRNKKKFSYTLLSGGLIYYILLIRKLIFDSLKYRNINIKKYELFYANKRNRDPRSRPSFIDRFWQYFACAFIFFFIKHLIS